MADRRVLSGQECCDGCIDDALKSLQDLRQMLVDKQVELSDMQDGPLFLLIDMMRVGIRQFQTYEQLLPFRPIPFRYAQPQEALASCRRH